MPRIVGRKVYPSDLEERRVLFGLGVPCLHIPRRTNPYAVARFLRRAAHQNRDVLFLSDIVASRQLPVRTPSPDTSEPAPDGTGG